MTKKTESYTVNEAGLAKMQAEQSQPELPVLNLAVNAPSAPLIEYVGESDLSAYIKRVFVGRAVSPEAKIEQYDQRRDKSETRESLYTRENLPKPTTRGLRFAVRFANFAVSFQVHTDNTTKRVFFSQVALWTENPAKYDTRKAKGRGQRFSIDDSAKFIRHSATDSRLTDSGDQWLDDSWQESDSQWSLIVAQVMANKSRWFAVKPTMDHVRD